MTKVKMPERFSLLSTRAVFWVIAGLLLTAGCRSAGGHASHVPVPSDDASFKPDYYKTGDQSSPGSTVVQPDTRGKQ